MINISKLYCGRGGQSDALRYSAANSFGPVVAFNCTNRCNLNCLHCYSSSTSDRSSNQLSTTEAKQLLSGLAKVNCPVVLFTGGEPLLRDDLFELLAEAERLGLQTAISSNGTLIDSAAADKLAEAGVNYVGISIDGDQEFHDAFRQSKGCFKAALTGIENCQKAGLKTGLRFTITKSNISQIPFVFELTASANVRRICFYHLIKAGRAKNNPSAARYTLSAVETRRAVETIIEKTDECVRKNLVDEVLTVGNHADGPFLLLKMLKENNANFETARKLLLDNGGNKIGEKITCASFSGSVHPDQFWQNYSLGNIKDRAFKTIWENPDELVLNKLRNKSKFADERCLKCKWFDLCKGNFRFLNAETDDKYWLNEPACYLTDEEIA
jgi:radical SAM protein with 4Fe4S-binding SPASM domain